MFKVSLSPLSTAAKRIRWGFLGLTSTPLMGAYLHNQEYPVPLLSCPIRSLTGIPCPTCGMTRSFLALAKGDLMQSVAFNGFGPILFAGFLIAGVHIAAELIRDRPIQTFYSHLLRQRQVQVSLLLSVVLYHSYRLYGLASSGELTIAFWDSPLGQFLL